MVWFADEVFFEVCGKISHTWGPKGKKIIVKNNGSSGKDCVIGAIEPYEGKSFFLQWDWIDSKVVEHFLKNLSELYPDKKHLIIMDNATYHKNQGGEDFPLPKNVELFFLPPYSPDFNFGVEIGGRYTTTDYLDGYSSQYSKSNDVYYFLNVTVTYKMKTGKNGLPSFRQ